MNVITAKYSDPLYSLGRSTAGFRAEYDESAHTIGFTINLPNTLVKGTRKTFEEMLIRGQMEIYKSIIRDTMDKLGHEMSFEYRYVYEFCKSGKTHVHGIVYTKSPCFPQGLVQDFTKLVYRTTRKYMLNIAKYDSKYYYDNEYGVTFRAPMICVDYIQYETDYVKWLSYITKSISPSKDL